jgi:predicted RNA-binding Zn-ribbon protein involved in translation (DUF1610 family)
MSAPAIDAESAPPPSDVPAKTTLYCPVCGHESPVSGDWLVRERGGRTVYVCPTCGDAIVTR